MFLCSNYRQENTAVLFGGRNLRIHRTTLLCHLFDLYAPWRFRGLTTQGLFHCGRCCDWCQTIIQINSHSRAVQLQVTSRTS